MACNFTIETTEPIAQLIAKAQSAINSKGGSFKGDTVGGNYSLNTPLGAVAGKYGVSGNKINFEITDKPLLVGCGLIEGELRKYLQ